jgi:hypothetical protein
LPLALEIALIMARTYVVFRDIEGKLDLLRVECRRCQRRGHYSIRKLIEKYGRKGHMMKWRELLSSDYQPGASTAPG